MTNGQWLAVGVLVGVCASPPARAQEAEVDKTFEAGDGARAYARNGLFLPSTLSPLVGGASALAFGFGGYDGARRAPVGGATAEVRVWGPFALRGGAEYSEDRRQLRPSVGGRVQLLRQGRHGVDGALSVFYRPEGLTEAEGEIETFASVARRFDRLYVVGNLVYGQDPEGNERDGEVRSGLLYGAGRWTVGLDARLRFAIGQQKSANAAAEPKMDLFVAPTVNAAVGPVALFAAAGPSWLRTTGSTSAGVEGLAGVGAAF